MKRTALLRPRRPARRPLFFRPRLEALESRWVPTAASPLRDLPGFTLHDLGRNDDQSAYVDLGFTVNFFGTEYSKVYVNNNGSVSFAAPYDGYLGDSMQDVTIPILAAFSADVDTNPANSGVVNYGRGKIDGHDAFVVNWPDVSYFETKPEERNDATNTFQLLIIDRDAAGTDIYDVELNYATIQWESGSSGQFGLNGQPPEVGFSAGTGQPGTFFEVPGSGQNGTLLDGAPFALVTANPTNEQAGRRVFQAREGVLTDVVAPFVEITQAPATVGAGVEWVAAGRFTDAGTGPWQVVVDYADGTPPQEVIAAADGSFEFSHVFTTQGTRNVTVTVTDPSGAVGTARARVFVLPAGSTGKIKQSTVEVAGPGETVWPTLQDADGTAVTAAYTRSADATGEVSVFLAIYDGAPLETMRQGTFLDIQVGGAAAGDQIVVTISSELLKGNFEFGYFDQRSGTWVNLLARPDLCEVTVDAATGQMTVRFNVIDIFEGTVFTVSLASGPGVTTTTNVQPATASAGDTSGLGRSVSFTSNTQLAVALTSSQNSQLAGRASAQGSQGGAAGAGPSGGQFGASAGTTASGAASDGKPGEGRGVAAAQKAGLDDATLWQLITGDELLMKLWVQGADLSWLMTPSDEGGSVGAFLPEEGAEGAEVPVAASAEGLVAFDGEEMAVALPAAAEADDSRLALLALAVAGVGAWRREEKRAKGRLMA